MAIQVERWAMDVIEQMYPANSFSAFATNHDTYVEGGKTVHLPKAGGVGSVVKNRSTLPATATTRTDVPVSYDLDEFTISPTHLKDAEKVELSYDKRLSIVNQFIDELRTQVHDDLLHIWVGNALIDGTPTALPAGNIIETTGTLTNGKRLITIADFIKIRTMMNKANLPADGRYVVMDSELEGQLYSITELIKADTMGGPTLPQGVIGRLAGINIITRSYTPVYDAAKAVKPKGAAPASTDRRSCIFFHTQAVSRAVGEVKLFESQNDPLYYGDVYSALIRTGGVRMRQDGVYVLVEANS